MEGSMLANRRAESFSWRERMDGERWREVVPEVRGQCGASTGDGLPESPGTWLVTRVAAAEKAGENPS